MTTHFNHMDPFNAVIVGAGNRTAGPELAAGRRSSVYLNIEKLCEPQKVRVAAEHNKRTRYFCSAEVAGKRGDDCRSNEVLWGPATAEMVAGLARALMLSQGVKKVRKNGVRAIEIMLSMSLDHGIDDRSFYIDSMNWFADRLGGRENILSADVHRDEANDHVHLLFLPLVGGRMIGSELLGGRSKFRGLRSDFDREVCRRHGVSLLIKNHLSRAEKVGASKAAIEALEKKGDAVLQSPIWPVVRNHIKIQPDPYLEPLGLDPTAFRTPRKLRTVAAIMTSKGKGPAKEERCSS